MKIFNRNHILHTFHNHTFDLAAYLVHEMSHYTVAIILYYASPQITAFPKFVIRRWGSTKVMPNDYTTTESHSMHVSIDGIGRYNISVAAIVAAPAITTICLFVVSPLWMWLLYLNNLTSLWLSTGDFRYLKKYVWLKTRKINKRSH